MYKARILKNVLIDSVNIQLTPPQNKWDAEVLKELAELMKRHEILKLDLPKGKTYFEITNLPFEYLANFSRDMESLGFSIE